jgi:hypothetical protein
MEVFEDNDPGYHAWVYAHLSGYVVNALRGAHPGEPILHRAICDSITPTPDRTWTSGDYLKACADKRYELDAWCRELGERLRPCPLCDP